MSIMCLSQQLAELPVIGREEIWPEVKIWLCTL